MRRQVMGLFLPRNFRRCRFFGIVPSYTLEPIAATSFLLLQRFTLGIIIFTEKDCIG
jgi:hypothetical protein